MGDPKRLSKTDILQADDLEKRDIHVPEWGGIVTIRALTGKERDEFEASVMVRTGKELTVNPRRLRAKLVAASMIGEDGKRLFSDKEVDDLAAKSSAALDRVFRAAQELSGIGEKEIERIEEDLEETPAA